MARDSTRHKVKASLKQAGIKPFKYTKDIGRALLFDSLPNQFSESLPTFGSIYQTGSDTAASLSSFAASRTDVLKRGIDKFFGNEGVALATRQAKTLIKQVKSGTLYTPSKDEDLFGGLNDDLLDNFGGVDMNYDDEGEYVEVENTQTLDNVNIATAQNRADNERTKAMMSAIGSSSEAQMKWSQTLTQASLQVQAKFHDETLSAMRNQLTVSSAIYETMNTRLSEMQTMVAEANRSLVTDVAEIKGYLKTISASYTNKNKFKASANNDPLANGFSIDAYIAQIKKNFNDSEFGIISSMLPMMLSLSQMDTRKKNNPILYLTDEIAKAIVPDKTKKRMERSDKTLNAFADALLSKLADMDGGNSIFGQIFGYKQKMNTTIKTARDLSYATHWTGKDSKALTDVIPTQLAQIISLMSGRPLQLFDYKSGTFKNSYKQAGVAYRDIHQQKSYSDMMNTIRGRARKINFGTDTENEEFQNYVEMFLNSAIRNGSNINPYKQGFNPLEGTNAKREYSTAITGLLKSLGKNGLIELGSEIQSSRSERSYRANAVNSELVESSMIMAFSQIGMAGMDENGQDRLLNRILSRVKDKDKPVSSREIMRMMRQAKSGAAAKSGPNSIQAMVRDIRNIIRRGIITYSYGISNGGAGTPAPPGFDDALKDARAARRMVTRKAQYTNTDTTRRVGQVSTTERQSILRRVRIGGLSNSKLEEYANKLGYGSVNELIDQANSESPDVSGDSIRYHNGMTSAEIAQQMRNMNLVEDPSLLETMASEHVNDRVKGRFGQAKTSIDRFRSRISGKLDKIRSPFKLMDYALDSLDSAMFKILYGDIPDEDKDDQKSVMDLIRAAIETQTEKFGDFLNKKLDFIDDKLFGKDGLLKKATNWIAGKLVGTRGEDGTFSGGKFSDLANKAVATGKSGVLAWASAMKEQLIGTKSGASRRVRGFDGQWKTVEDGYQGGLIQPLRDKVQDLKEWLFGRENEMTDSKKLAADLGKELKNVAPSMGKGAAIGVGTWLASGLLTGMFLPGGPLLSGIIGSATGLIKKSDKLREYLFGIEGDDGKRRGGLFSDNVYKGLTKYIPNIANGAGIGATLGNLGLLPFGLGNMAGLVFGSMGGLVKSSDELRTFLFGTEDDDNSGLINKKLRNRLKDIIPGWLIGKTTGSALWNIISNAGLIPGLALLPGGPVFSAIGGLVGAFSKEHVENFLFGKKDKDGKRDNSGIFSKAFSALKDRVMSPLANNINKIGDNIGGWFKEVVTDNLKDFFSPVTELFKRGLNKMKKKSMDITDILRGAFATVIDKTLGRFFKFIGRKLFGKKGEDGKRKGGIIRTVASMPFQALGAIGRKMTAGINWADRRFEAKEYRRYQKQLKKDKKAGTAWQDEAGNWHVADEEAFNAESQNRREKRGAGGNFWDTMETFRQRGQQSRENADARAERYRLEREEKAKAKQQGDATAEAMAPQVQTIGAGVSRTNSLLEQILRAMGGTPSTDLDGETLMDSGASAPAASVATATASGPNTILQNATNVIRQGVADLASGESTEVVTGNYLQKLYDRADKAMSSSSDPRKTADEIISTLPPEYAKDGIEIVNRVYELNYGPTGAKVGGNNGKTTGLWDTITGLLNIGDGGGLLTSAGNMLTQLLSGGGISSIASALGLGGAAAGLKTLFSKGASSAGADALSSAASSGSKGILGKITSVLKNPKALAKGGAMTGAVLLGLSALGALQNGNEEGGSFGSNLMSGAKTAASGLADWYTSSEGIMSTMATTVKSGKERVLNKSIFAGIGSLTPAEIVKVAKGEAIDIGDSLSRTVGENGVRRLARGASAVKSTASKVVSKVSESGIAQNLTKVASAVKDKIVAAAKIFFDSKAVKALMGALGKSASKIPSAIGNVLDNALVNALKNAAKKVGSTAASLAAKAASTISTGGLLLIAFGIADFMSGMSDANKYFKVRESEDTIGMKVVSGIVKCLQGLISNLLASTGAGILGSIAVALIDTGWIAQMLYKKIVGEEGEQELAEKQAALEADCAKYNEENGTNLSVEEYSEKVDSGGIVKSVKSAFSSAATTVKNAASSVKDAAVNLFSNAKNTVVSGVKNLFSSNASKSEEGLTTEDTGTKSIASKGIKALSSLITSGLTAIFKIGFVKNIIGDKGSVIIKVIDEALDRVAANVSDKNLLQVVADKALAVPKAVVAFYNGYRNPTKYLDIYGEDLNDRHSIAAGIGAAVASLTQGAMRGKDVATRIVSILEEAKARTEAKKNTKLTSATSTSATKITSLDKRESSASDGVNYEDDDSGKPTGKTAGVFSAIKNAVTSAFSKFTSWITGKGRGRGRFGRGEYFSQTDPKWNRYNPEMSESGCGPTVAAMMASHYGKGRWGRSANPIEADYMSRNMPGMRDPDGGTNPKFFEEYGASKGIDMQAGAPNKNAVASTLASGNAVGLMGEGGPFGSNMHYMMADGIDQNGNVNIVDPYGGQSTTQPIGSVIRNTDTAIYANNLAPDGLPYEEGSPQGMGRRFGRSKASTRAKKQLKSMVSPKKVSGRLEVINDGNQNIASGKLGAGHRLTGIGRSYRGFGRGRSRRGSLTSIQSAIVEVAKNWRKYTSKGLRASAGMCEAWVEDVYYFAGKNLNNTQMQSVRYKYGTAFADRNACRVSTDWSKIPVGAVVYAGDGYTQKTNTTAGHVGIYIGGGQVISCVGNSGNDAPCHIQSLDSWCATSGSWCFYGSSANGGWGWLGCDVPNAVADDGSVVSSGSVSSSGVGSQADDIIAVAKAEIGYKEKASNSQLDDKTANAGSGNYTKYGAELGGTGPGWPWCHQFVSWCAKHSGCGSIIPITASCAEGVSWFSQKGQFHTKSGYTPKKGDIIYFGSSGGDHVGLVSDCDGKYVYTIEGNTGSQGTSSVVAEGNAVCDKKYPLDTARIYGYGSPAYGGSTGVSTSSSENSYSGVFGAFQKVFDQVQSELDKIFAPLTGSSTSDTSSSTTDSSGTTSSGTVGSVSSDSGGALSGGSTFPTYTLSDSDKKFIAGVSSQEQNESDIAAQRLEVSQMANLNEVEYKRGTTGSDLLSTLKGNWYAQTSVNRGYRGDYSPQAMQAVEEVLVQGKRTLPRHVTEHDYYGDISNINLNPSTETGKQNRINMKPGDTIKNTMGSTYRFYKFAGKDGASGSGDPFGSKSQYIKSPYTEDIPWGSGRGGRGSSPSEIYRTGGIQGQVKAMNASMAQARANDNINRKMEAVDTQAKAMQKAASSGAYGKGADSAAVTQIAKAMTQVVELLTEIRDQNASFTKAAETKRSNKSRNPFSSQTKLSQNDPGTSSMSKMAVRS